MGVAYELLAAVLARAAPADVDENNRLSSKKDFFISYAKAKEYLLDIERHFAICYWLEARTGRME